MAWKKGQILIKEVNDLQFTLIKSWGKMKWSRDEQMFYGPADVELLNLLAQIVPLPGPIETERQRLNGIAAAVDMERARAEPKALYPYPVKYPLYKHQVKAANMALITFGLVSPQEGNQEGR